MDILLAVCVLLGCAVLSYFLTGELIKLLTKKNIFDIPNFRSSHKSPTPVGGGIGIIITFFVGCLPFVFIYSDTIKSPLIIFLGLSLLCVISFRDDVKHVSVAMRLITHFIAAVLGALIVQHNGQIFKGIVHPYLEFVFIIFAIVVFLNLFNFMDGIDGITGSETIYLCISISIILCIINYPSSYIYISLLLASCTIGFLIYNWHPARIFIGDTGSITVGYLLALLLLITAAKGAWLQAIVLPMYYFADAGFVLFKRALKLEKIWQAHSDHFFQHAVKAGISHAEVVIKIMIINFALLIISLSALKFYGNVVIEFGFLLLGILVCVIGIRILPEKIPALDIKAKRKKLSIE